MVEAVTAKDEIDDDTAIGPFTDGEVSMPLANSPRYLKYIFEASEYELDFNTLSTVPAIKLADTLGNMSGTQLKFEGSLDNRAEWEGYEDVGMRIKFSWVKASEIEMTLDTVEDAFGLLGFVDGPIGFELPPPPQGFGVGVTSSPYENNVTLILPFRYNEGVYVTEVTSNGNILQGGTQFTANLQNRQDNVITFTLGTGIGNRDIVVTLSDGTKHEIQLVPAP